MINDIIASIDSSIAAVIDSELADIYHGFADHYDNGDELYSGTLSGSTVTKITFDDAYDIQTYHIVESLDVSINEEFSFGSQKLENDYQVYIILMLKNTYNIDEYSRLMLKSIPRKIVLAGYNRILIEGGNIDLGEDAI